MLPDDARNRVELLEAAEHAIRAIWNWDYLDWDALAPYVTGQLAALFHANVASKDGEEDMEPVRDLTDLALDIHTIEEENKALVLARYSWNDHSTPSSESVVWVFIKEDGVWRASGIGRESDFTKKEENVLSAATPDGAPDRKDV